jgi:hypothetical protein
MLSKPYFRVHAMSNFETSNLQQLSRECISLHLYGSQIELILTALAILQQKIQEGEEQQPFSSTEIDSLRAEINESIVAYMRSPIFRWKQQVAEMSDIDHSTNIWQLISYLDYAVQKNNLSEEQALEVLAGERNWLLEIEQEQEREGALVAFDEIASSNQANEGQQLFFFGSRYDFCITFSQTWFEITATLRGSDKRSTINTLNYILSAFDIDLNSTNVGNPEWSGTPQQVQTWIGTAQSLFGDRSFLEGLEKALDQDRQEGEWESV